MTYKSDGYSNKTITFEIFKDIQITQKATKLFIEYKK